MSGVVVVSEGACPDGQRPGLGQWSLGVRVLEGGPGRGDGSQWRCYSESPGGERGRPHPRDLAAVTETPQTGGFRSRR